SRECVTLAGRDRRQVDAVGDVADRVDMWRGGAGKAVDLDAAIVRIEGDTRLLQPEISNTWMPADREHHLIGRHARSVGQMRREFLAVLVDLADGTAGQDGDPSFSH